jgi:hypothetical protein
MLVPRIDEELRVEAEGVVAAVVFEAPERSEVVRLDVVDEARCIPHHEGNPDLAAWAERFLVGYLKEHPEAVREKLAEARQRREPVQPTVSL